MPTTGKKARIATQVDGMPQGRHLTGFKGTKVEGACFCGKCNPAAVAGKNRTIVFVEGKKKLV